MQPALHRAEGARRGLIRPRRDDEFCGDVIAGLGSSPKSIPSRWLWDTRGTQIFERICDTPEYYLARAERSLIERHGAEIADAIGSRAVLVELGPIDADRASALFERLDAPQRYVPVEPTVARSRAIGALLRRRHPRLAVAPIAADYTRASSIAREVASAEAARTTVLLGGASIGNFHPHDAVSVLARAALIAGRGGTILVTSDRKKPKRAIEAAYDDRMGVTAAFNRNVLVRINREIGATFDVTRFSHRAPYDPIRGRVEMRLVADVPQRVIVGGFPIDIARGEWIVTEHAYKYDPAELAQLARRAGLEPRRWWSDPAQKVSLHELAVR